MGEQFDASRPIYAQLVERLKARILAGTYPPGGGYDSLCFYFTTLLKFVQYQFL